MPRPFDPVSKASDAMVALLAADAFIVSLNWRDWENNTDHAALPRGYVNVSGRSALDNAWLPEAFRFEIIIEAKPQVALDKEKLATVLGHITRLDLATALNALIVDGSLTFEGIAEELELSREIVGETRQYKFMFNLYGQWQVAYVPD